MNHELVYMILKITQVIHIYKVVFRHYSRRPPLPLHVRSATSPSSRNKAETPRNDRQRPGWHIWNPITYSLRTLLVAPFNFHDYNFPSIIVLGCCR